MTGRGGLSNEFPTTSDNALRDTKGSSEDTMVFKAFMCIKERHI